jgi:hypothetical protein
MLKKTERKLDESFKKKKEKSSDSDAWLSAAIERDVTSQGKKSCIDPGDERGYSGGHESLPVIGLDTVIPVDLDYLPRKILPPTANL